MSKLKVLAFTVSIDGYGAGLGFRVTEHVPTSHAAHVVLAKGCAAGPRVP